MKLFIVLITLFVISYSSFSQESNSRKVEDLILKEEKIYSILDQLSREEIENYNWNRSIFIINVKKPKEQLELRISIVYKEGFAHYLNQSQDTIYGLFKFRERDVLIFGDKANTLFLKSGITKEISYLNLPPKSKKEDKKEFVIPPPPTVYEPLVWIYALKDNCKFKLIDKGLFELLD